MEQIDLGALVQDVEYKAARILLEAVQKGDVTDSESREIATYILEQTESLASVEQIDTFLQTLAQKWPMFQPISQLTHLKVSEAHDTEAALTKVKEQLATVTT